MRARLMRVNDQLDQLSRNAINRASLPLDLIRDARITDRIRSLLLELAGYAWGQSAICWPSNGTLAKSLGKHPDTIRDVLAEAEALGFITRITDRRRTIVLRWKLRSGGALSPTPPSSAHPDHPAEAPPKALNQKQGEKRNVAVVGQATQGPPPTDDQKERPALAPSSSSVFQGDEPVTAGELAEMACTVIAGGPLASFYRVALAKSGISSDEAIKALAEPQAKATGCAGPGAKNPACREKERAPEPQPAIRRSSATGLDSRRPRAWSKRLTGPRLLEHVFAEMFHPKRVFASSDRSC